MFVRVHIKRVVWTSLRASLTADTAAVVEINDAVGARVKRGHGTNLDTRRVGAVITAHHRKKPSRIGKFAFFDIFDPRSIDADRNLMLGFTRHRAGVTADTLAVINDKTKVHINFCFVIKSCFLEIVESFASVCLAARLFYAGFHCGFGGKFYDRKLKLPAAFSSRRGAKTPQFSNSR